MYSSFNVSLLLCLPGYYLIITEIEQESYPCGMMKEEKNTVLDI